MCAESHRGMLALKRRIRSMMDTILSGSPELGAAEESGLMLHDTEAILHEVMEELGDTEVQWQSHELIERIHSACRNRGESGLLDAIDQLISWPVDESVNDSAMKLVTDRIAHFSGTQVFESAIANSYLGDLWPVHGGLTPTQPFRFLERRIEVESHTENEDSIHLIGDRVVSEIEWVAGSLVVSGALEELSSLPPQDGRHRWDLLQARIRGYIEAQQQSPQVIWEVPALARIPSGQLFADPMQQERHEIEIRHLCESAQLLIRVPLPIPASTRLMLAECLRGSVPVRICSDQHPRPVLVAGRLDGDPLAVRAICQRVMAFDHVADHGISIPWREDWNHAKKLSTPLWIASEKSNPLEFIDYLLRNSLQSVRIPAIGIESREVALAYKAARKLISKITRRRGGGWNRLEELLAAVAISPRLLASTAQRT